MSFDGGGSDLGGIKGGGVTAIVGRGGGGFFGRTRKVPEPVGRLKLHNEVSNAV